MNEPLSLVFTFRIYFLRNRIFFLIREAHEGVRFLTRWSPCNPEAII
jgi:hypothetical protein